MLDEFEGLDRVGLVEEVEMSGTAGEEASKLCIENPPYYYSFSLQLELPSRVLDRFDALNPLSASELNTLKSTRNVMFS